jgi:hypothetical protein
VITIAVAAQIIADRCHALALAHAALVAADEHRDRARGEALAFIVGYTDLGRFKNDRCLRKSRDR